MVLLTAQTTEKIRRRTIVFVQGIQQPRGRATADFHFVNDVREQIPLQLVILSADLFNSTRADEGCRVFATHWPLFGLPGRETRGALRYLLHRRFGYLFGEGFRVHERRIKL